ncbi:hypothetical protein T492DRAFT_928563 [Pavlovales sp. CCMP2436]|nr:hypothetical protein T492DRAFT_928563 [Pavlovales sp. CCMP2436]|eukprot:CAMPEP_0179858940 /NCGR_PEP_ID=MMETSP0982-20121206/12723_1 /TAXON_ID=483367 /ORGANISM="non described non described, Strain CCMP 2436" /LENGTH=104 /DNA_ID=CAMNT_0021745903 /DNA_START=265 /DNA_END=579 /DNA_ORIENTATION=+
MSASNVVKPASFALVVWLCKNFCILLITEPADGKHTGLLNRCHLPPINELGALGSDYTSRLLQPIRERLTREYSPNDRGSSHCSDATHCAHCRSGSPLTNKTGI